MRTSLRVHIVLHVEFISRQTFLDVGQCHQQIAALETAVEAQPVIAVQFATLCLVGFFNVLVYGFRFRLVGFFAVLYEQTAEYSVFNECVVFGEVVPAIDKSPLLQQNLEFWVFLLCLVGFFSKTAVFGFGLID